MKSVLLLWTPPFKDRGKLKGQYTDVKSRCGTSVGPSLNPPQSQLKLNSRDTVPLRSGIARISRIWRSKEESTKLEWRVN